MTGGSRQETQNSPRAGSRSPIDPAFSPNSTYRHSNARAGGWLAAWSTVFNARLPHGALWVSSYQYSTSR